MIWFNIIGLEKLPVPNIVEISNLETILENMGVQTEGILTLVCN